MKSLQKFTMSAIGLLAGTFVASGAAIDPSNYAAFKEGKNDIPAEWKGMSVRYEQKLGFCEVWREGKEIMLNGHVQRFRGFWNQGLPGSWGKVNLK